MAGLIKIFGERNTSTNALTHLIRMNSQSQIARGIAPELDPGIAQRVAKVAQSDRSAATREAMIDAVFEKHGPQEAWKHTTPNFDDARVFSGCHVIFCVRHPASWVLGLHIRPYCIHGRPVNSISEFLDKQWVTVGRERLGRKKTGAIALYNAKMKAYEQFQQKLSDAGISFSIVRHEDFAVDQKGVFTALAPYLRAPAQQPALVEASTKDKGKTRSYYTAYYGKQMWRREIDAHSMMRINAGICWKTLDPLGYRPVEPGDAAI